MYSFCKTFFNYLFIFIIYLKYHFYTIIYILNFQILDWFLSYLSVFVIFIVQSRVEDVLSHNSEDSVFETDWINVKILDCTIISGHNFCNFFYIYTIDYFYSSSRLQKMTNCKVFSLTASTNLDLHKQELDLNLRYWILFNVFKALKAYEDHLIHKFYL